MSTIDRTYPQPADEVTSAGLRAQFGAAADDIEALEAQAGNSQPFSPILTALAQGDPLPVENGGTGADLSGTGGAGQFLRQLLAGGPITVEVIDVADLPPSGAEAGSYGSASAAVVLAVDDRGRVTSVATAAITPGEIGAVPTGRTISAGTGLSGGGALSGDISLAIANTITAAGPIGTASTVPVITFNARGQLTTVTTATITPAAIGAATTATVLSAFAAPTAPLSIGSQRLTSVADPSAAQDAATKAYVDAVAQGLDAKGSVRAATTGNITLSGAQTIDGIAVIAGNRVLVKDQSAPAANGIYVVAAGAWTRATDADIWAELPSAYAFVEEGTSNKSAGFVCTSAAGGTLGTTAITWTQFSGAGQIVNGTGLTKTGNTLAVDTSVIAALNAPALVNPTATTQSPGNNSALVATTAFVTAAVASGAGLTLAQAQAAALCL